MKPHIHTDVLHLFVFATATLVIAHFYRASGAWLAAHGAGALGKPLGSLATLGD